MFFEKIRHKMMNTRKRREHKDLRNAILVAKKVSRPRTLNGEKGFYDDEVDNMEIKEIMDLWKQVDVEALYPSLNDLEPTFAMMQ